VGGEAATELAFVRLDHILGDRQRDARAAQLRRVHVAVHPDGGPVLVGVAPDGHERDIAAFVALADAGDPHEIGVRLLPRGQLGGQLGVIEVFVAKHGRRFIRKDAILLCCVRRRRRRLGGKCDRREPPLPAH
jgi:hypothetical protein